MTKKRLTKKQKLFLEAYEASIGNVSVACTKAGIGRTTFYDWMQKANKPNTFDTFKERIEQLNEEAIDMAESALKKQIAKGNVQAIKYFLDRKGRSRGYGEVLQVEVPEPVRIILPDNNRLQKIK